MSVLQNHAIPSSPAHPDTRRDPEVGVCCDCTSGPAQQHLLQEGEDISGPETKLEKLSCSKSAQQSDSNAVTLFAGGPLGPGNTHLRTPLTVTGEAAGTDSASRNSFLCSHGNSERLSFPLLSGRARREAVLSLVPPRLSPHPRLCGIC